MGERSTGFLNGMFKPLERERFQQVVGGVQVKCLVRMLGVGRGKDCHGLLRNMPQQAYPTQHRHLDVEEKQVHRLTLQELYGAHGAVAGSYQLQIRHIPDVFLQESQRKMLIISE